MQEATEEGNPAIRLSDELVPWRLLLVAVITSVSQLMSQTLGHPLFLVSLCVDNSMCI